MDVPPDRVMQMVPCPGRGPGPPAQGPGAPGPGPCIIANVLPVLPLFLFLSTMFSALPHSIHMSVRHEPRARAPGPEQRAPARGPGPVPWPRAPARGLGPKVWARGPSPRPRPGSRTGVLARAPGPGLPENGW